MSDVKISGMTPGSALTGAELGEMVQSGGTFSFLMSQIKTYVFSTPAVFTEAVGSSAITLTGATQVASHPAINATQTWNNGAVTFTGLLFNVTSTASAAASLLIDLQVGGVSQFNVGKAGVVTQTGNTVYSAAAAGPTLKTGANGRTGTFVCNGATPVTVSNTSVATTDVIVISLSVVGGSVGAIPHLATITAATGFTVVGTAGDTSTYSYAIIKVA